MQDSHWGAERPASEPEQEAEFEGLVGFCQVKGREEKDIPGVRHASRGDKARSTDKSF